MSIRILVDSGVDLHPALRGKIEVLPLTVRFGETEYKDGVDLTNKQFYDRLQYELPQTSQIPPADFEAVFHKLHAAGDSAVLITLSSGVSGTYQSAVIAAQGYVGSVWVVDSQSVAVGCGVLAEYALRLKEQGLDAEQIADALIKERENVRVYAVVDTLEYLKKGGRLSAAEAFAGSLLGIKPLVGMKEGKVATFGKARGQKQAFVMLDKLVQQTGFNPERPLCVGYTGIEDTGLETYLAASKVGWNKEIPIATIGAAIGTHVGPGAVAVAYFIK